MADSGFPRSVRLLKPEQFERVFQDGRRHSSKWLPAITASNSRSGSRLGLTVSKKAAPRAVDRNRLKRCIRESFRLRQTGLPPVDIIVTARAGAVALAPVQLRSQLDQLWTRIAQACAES